MFREKPSTRKAESVFAANTWVKLNNNRKRNIPHPIRALNNSHFSTKMEKKVFFFMIFGHFMVTVYGHLTHVQHF